MRNAHRAEEFLTLFFEPGRASALVGDLLEGDPGYFSFWAQVAQAAMSQCVSQLGASRRTIFQIGLLSYAVSLGFWALWFVPALFSAIFLAAGHHPFWSWIWVWADNSFTQTIVPSYFTGRWLAPRIRGPLAPSFVGIFLVWELLFLIQIGVPYLLETHQHLPTLGAWGLSSGSAFAAMGLGLMLARRAKTSKPAASLPA